MCTGRGRVRRTNTCSMSDGAVQTSSPTSSGTRTHGQAYTWLRFVKPYAWQGLDVGKGRHAQAYAQLGADASGWMDGREPVPAYPTHVDPHARSRAAVAPPTSTGSSVVDCRQSVATGRDGRQRGAPGTRHGGCGPDWRWVGRDAATGSPPSPPPPRARSAEEWLDGKMGRASVLSLWWKHTKRGGGTAASQRSTPRRASAPRRRR